MPPVAAALPRDIQQLTPMQYRNLDQLEPGGVLVVGASASGTQIADEAQRSGRPVTLAVGEHVRVPRVYLSGSLRNVCDLADLKMNRLLNTIDEWAAERGVDHEVDAPQRYDATVVEASPPLLIDLARSQIKTVVWATGFRPDYSWLDVPVTDHKGQIRHDGGVVVEAPGMYLLGLPFLRRRKSSLIDGVGDDARDLSAHLIAYLRQRPSTRRTVAELLSQ